MMFTRPALPLQNAQVLRRAGASKVWVATVARTLKLASNYRNLQADADEDSADEVVEEPEELLAKAAES